VIDAGHEIRPATGDDTDPLADTLARAFDDDPVMSWLFTHPERRLRQNRRFFGLRLRQFMPQGDVYTTPDQAGAAIWATPGQWRLPMLTTLRMFAALAPAVGRRGTLAIRGMQRIEEAHPKAPHYYLAVLGTEPEQQGRGVGSALLQPVLEACDRDEVPAYLESSKERNVAFYARHGFRVTEEIELPKGPPVWLMWREPRA